jgi:hypothetical protein
VGCGWCCCGFGPVGVVFDEIDELGWLFIGPTVS